MNLCEDIGVVIGEASSGASVDWNQITAGLEHAVTQDVDSWYGPTVLLALMFSTRATTIAVQQGMLDPTTNSGAVVVAVA